LRRDVQDETERFRWRSVKEEAAVWLNLANSGGPVAEGGKALERAASLLMRRVVLISQDPVVE